MNIGLCSWSDRKQVHSLTWPLLNKYCSLHGYRFTTCTSSFQEGVAGSWMKLKMLQQQEGLDYLVWFDDDIIITSEKAISEYISELPEDKIFGISRCSMTAGQVNRFIFNMGLMVVKCEEQSRYWLEDIWRRGIETKWRNKKLWEQDYITRLYKTSNEFKSLVHLYNYGTIQTYVRPYGLPVEYAWKPGDFSAHITGQACNNRAKHRRIQSFINANV